MKTKRKKSVSLWRSTNSMISLIHFNVLPTTSRNSLAQLHVTSESWLHPRDLLEMVTLTMLIWTKELTKSSTSNTLLRVMKIWLTRPWPQTKVSSLMSSKTVKLVRKPTMLQLMKKSLKKVKNLRSPKRKPLRSFPTVLWSRKSFARSACTTSEYQDSDVSWLFALNSIHASMRVHSMPVSPIWNQLFQDKKSKIMKRKNSKRNNNRPEKIRKLTKKPLNSHLITENGPRLKPLPMRKRKSNMSSALTLLVKTVNSPTMKSSLLSALYSSTEIPGKNLRKRTSLVTLESKSRDLLRTDTTKKSLSHKITKKWKPNAKPQSK